jgi:N,N-dimethylformamidase
MKDLIGYVSDEYYVALPDVLVEFVSGDFHCQVRSTASGAVRADLPPGQYQVFLAKDGYGGKTIALDWPQPQPYQFRLLRKRLLGYVWPKWVKSGEEGEFRVHSPTAYKLELWRYGMKKERMRTIGWFDEHAPEACLQITPDGDYTQTGVRWNEIGYFSRHHKQYVIAPQRSGLYYFHARNESGEFFSFPWVVAPAKPSAPFAVLAACTTWNAYNNFGGRSNYIHPVALPDRPTVHARSELARYTERDHVAYTVSEYAPLSFDRPEVINVVPEGEEAVYPIEGRAACHVAPAEWRLLAWLEREGFRYDLYADVQLHFGEIDLSAYRVVILPPHPEYFSWSMYEQLKNWVHQGGGRLVYLGGNGINCEAEFLDRGRCVYRNEDARRLELGYESRFALRRESEARLLGVVYDDRGIMTAAPYRVVRGDHWVFEGTGLGTGDRFGWESLHQRVPGGASGHETDKVSASSPESVVLLAKGENPDDGGAEMAIYELESGGAVFAAGSICWCASLLVDEHVSAITRNVLQRFGW